MVARIYTFRTSMRLCCCTACRCSLRRRPYPWSRCSPHQSSHHRTGICYICTARGLHTLFGMGFFIRLVLEHPSNILFFHPTCFAISDSQSWRTHSIFRNIFHWGFLFGCTRRSRPRNSLCCCKRAGWAPGGTRHRFLTMKPGCFGTVVQRRVRSTHICHTLAPRGRCRPGCSPDGSLCTHTRLRRFVVSSDLWIVHLSDTAFEPLAVHLHHLCPLLCKILIPFACVYCLYAQAKAILTEQRYL